MVNFLSVMSLAGTFSLAVNLMCAATPATVIQVLGLIQ